jgi:hypothetical protein
MVVDTPTLSGVDWSRLASLALIEHRPGDIGRYDMLQAAAARPADLAVSPDRLRLSRGRPSAQVSLVGPHVLAWTATSDVPWFEVAPSGGSLPATVTVSVNPEHRPTGDWSGTVQIDAQGDGMAFSKTVDVALEGKKRRGGRRRRPVEPGTRVGG